MRQSLEGTRRSKQLKGRKGAGAMQRPSQQPAQPGWGGDGRRTGAQKMSRRMRDRTGRRPPQASRSCRGAATEDGARRRGQGAGKVEQEGFYSEACKVALKHWWRGVSDGPCSGATLA
jgi:hypothetical protein